MHLDPAVLIAVDFFALRAGDHGGLAAEHLGLRVVKRRTVQHIPGRGVEAVAVALLEAVAGLGVAGDGLFQHLRLLAFMADFGQQPELVPLLARVGAEVEVVAADQQRLVAFTAGQFVVAAVAFQVAFAQVFTALALDETAGVVVVLEVGAELAGECRFHQQTRFFEVVIAAGNAVAAGFQAQGEALDHRLVGDQTAVLLVSGDRQFREHRLVVAEDQHMPLLAVLEVVVNAFFLAQTLDKVQVRLVVLHAVFALGINRRAELEGVGVVLDAVFFQYLADDLLHREVLEDPLIHAVRQVGQLRAQGDVVTAQAFAGFALGDAVDQAVNAVATRREGEKGRLVQQTFQVDIRALADQFQFEGERLADRLAAAEFEDLQVVTDALDTQAEMGLVG
ncbi:hypothetical protein D3C85_376810 [compost metagenome]